MKSAPKPTPRPRPVCDDCGKPMKSDEVRIGLCRDCQEWLRDNYTIPIVIRDGKVIRL